MLKRYLCVLCLSAALAGCGEERSQPPGRVDRSGSGVDSHSVSVDESTDDQPSSRSITSDDTMAESERAPAQTLLPPQLAPMFDSPSNPSRTALSPYRSRSTTSTGSKTREPFTTIRVFYGTDRAATRYSSPKKMFGTKQGSVSFGFCDVSIPRRHEVGQLESPSIWRFEFREDPEKHVVLLRVLRRSEDEFVSALQQKVWGSMEVVDTPQGPALVGGEVFVFVHGYNNTFEDAARRTAQIAHDLKFLGAPVMYSWPSQAKSSLDAYRIDGQMTGWSEQHLVDFVTLVAKESGARRVHLIAHSMGNRLVSGALRRLVEQCVAGTIPKFNEVILTAPDVDAEHFKKAIAPRIVHAADRITIYSSSRDYALKASSFFNPSARRRLGEAGDELTVFPEYANIDVVDATAADTGLFALNHAYHGNSKTVLADIELLLQGYTAEQRGLSSMLNRLAWQIREAGRQITEGVTPPRR